jgi:hypothetical protein
MQNGPSRYVFATDLVQNRRETMPEIAPKMTKAQLSALSGGYLPDGRHRSEGLPGVTSDARKVEQDYPPVPGELAPQGYKNNRKLAELIQQALKDAKPGKDGEFLLAWRLYPNADHPRWQQEEPHNCGCGCSCSR